ncbi:ribosome biogenesis protein WDR12 [Tanacetum coccineum]
MTKTLKTMFFVVKMDMDEDVSRRVQVKFVTKLKAPLKVPETSIALPSTLTRSGLSAIVNNLLQSGNNDWTHEPFDFLIQNELVRMSLEEFLLAKSISAVDAESQDENQKISAYRTLRGHTASVQSLAAKSTGDMCVYGSWIVESTCGRTESLTKENVVVIEGKGNTGKKKGSKEEESQSEGEAVSTLVGHTQSVSSVVWPEHGTIYSASWDHSIRRWDVETGKDTLNMYCGKAINCIDVGGESSALIAGGGSDPILRIWDPRKPGTLAPSFLFQSHTSWITACKWHARSWFHLLSASHDGKLMLWDLRTAWPLAKIESHEDKVLAADWWNGDSVVSGGADSTLRIFSEICIP